MLKSLALPPPVPAASIPMAWRRVAGDIPAALGLFALPLALLALAGFLSP